MAKEEKEEVMVVVTIVMGLWPTALWMWQHFCLETEQMVWGVGGDGGGGEERGKRCCRWKSLFPVNFGVRRDGGGDAEVPSQACEVQTRQSREYGAGGGKKHVSRVQADHDSSWAPESLQGQCAVRIYTV